jgi:hypothetical protein
MRVIRQIGILTGPDGIEWISIGSIRNGLTVTSILNNGSEFESSIHSEYIFRDAGGNPVMHIENCPVIVEWMEVPDERIS